ncbi:TPA: DUF551 domain-containing protein [Klebsiella pneumoniae]|nr:DUF551 domain-containing protein [Klebsiella pneumoniae]
MTSKLTRERIELIANFHRAMTLPPSHAEIEELARMALAAMDSEPVYQYQSGVYNDDNGETDWYWDDCDKGFYEQYAHDRRRILYRHAQPVVPDDVQRDAKRWRALLGSARIRILGSAGFDATAHPGENPDYRHFGMEIWTHYPNWLHEKNEYGIDTLTQYADAMLAAAPQPQNEPQNIPEIIPGWIQVSERMPEDRISVILWDAEIGEVTSGHYSHKTQTFYHCGDAIENEITHWMPPPCAPQEVK